MLPLSLTKYLILCTFPFFLCESHLLPLRMPKCKSTDKKCLCSAATTGFKILKLPNKALGLPSIDPFVIQRIRVRPNEHSRVSFKQDYYHMQFIGKSAGRVTDFNVEMNSTHLRMQFDLYMDYFYMISWYKWKGQVMGYPIDGYGHLNITSVNVTHSHEMIFAIGKNNKLNLQRYEVDLKPLNLLFNMDSLVHSDAEASDRALKLFNDYSTPIFYAVKNDYDRTFAKAFTPYICAFFKYIRKEDLFLDA